MKIKYSKLDDPLKWPDIQSKSLEEWLNDLQDGDTIKIIENYGHIFLRSEKENQIYYLGDFNNGL